MAETSYEEKTEPATEKKRSEAREKGKVLKSVELNSAFVLVFGLMILYFSGAAVASQLSAIARTTFVASGAFEANVASVHRLLVDTIVHVLLVVAPLVIGLMLVGVLASVAQVGFVFSLQSLMPSGEKLNPLTGLKRIMLSRRSMVELLKNVLKILIRQ